MILFLDFDGVLHPEPCFDRANLFSCLPRLESVLTDFPDIQIVISSTWRENRTLDVLRGFFSEPIQQRIVGATPGWRDHQGLLEVIGYQRQTEIEAWLRSSSEPWMHWIAIDDKAYLFRPFLKNLIKTKSETGFDIKAERELRAMLSQIS
jgi:hypothetical protein